VAQHEQQELLCSSRVRHGDLGECFVLVFR
jgi:hypothetical protein